MPVVVLGFHHGSLGITRSLGRLGVPVVGVDRNPRAPALASRYLRERLIWDLPGTPAAATVAWLLELGLRWGSDGPPLLIPTTDDTALLVAEHADALSARFVFPRISPELIRSFSDKKELFFLAKRLGIPTAGAEFPQSTQDVQRFLDRAVFPVMLKGIDGTRLQARTGRKMVIVHSAGELLQQYRELEDPAAPNLMLQEYIPGGDDTIWMFNGYFNARSECLAAFTGKKLRQHPVHVGATSLGIQLANETVARTTIDFMRAVSYRGILDIGYRFDARDGQYKLLDPNPRVGQTFRLFLDRDGMDVVRCLYLDLTGQPVPPIVPREGRKWIVEDKDIDSCLDYRREGQLTFGAWRASLRGVEEGAWFARDDWAPFRRVAWQFARKVVRVGFKRLAAAVRRTLWNRPREWWGFAVNRRIKGMLGALAYGIGVHRRVFRDHAVILAFHRVADSDDFLSCPPALFRAHCDFFARHFQVVPLAELLERLRTGQDIGGRLAITFDDGYRDNHDVVAPELRRRNLPATFFVATELIGSAFIPSWDMKRKVRTEWMGWDEVRALKAQGFDIGSHTMHHVDLGKVAGADARQELVQSRERLERELGGGQEVRLFSYPYGQRHQMTEENLELVRAAGYRCCLSAFGGLVTPHTNPFRLQRVSVTPWHRSPGHLGWELLRQGRSAAPVVPA